MSRDRVFVASARGVVARGMFLALVTTALPADASGSIHGPFAGWSSVSNLPTARGYLAAASVSGTVYAIGGYDGSVVYSTVYAYDPLQPAQGWRSVSNLPAVRHLLAAASAGGKIYAIGGRDASSYYSTVYVYDPLQPAQGWSVSINNMDIAAHWCLLLGHANRHGVAGQVGDLVAASGRARAALGCGVGSDGAAAGRRVAGASLLWAVAHDADGGVA